MKEKLEEYIKHIKDVCESSEVRQLIEADEQIKAYALLEREPHRPYETRKAFAINRLQEAVNACNEDTLKPVDTKIDTRIFLAFKNYLDIKINIAAHQSFNRFERDQEEIYEAVDYHATDAMPDNLTKETKKTKINPHTELFCLHLLSTFVINRTNDYLLHDVLLDLLCKLNLLTRSTPSEVDLLVIGECQKLLAELNQLPGENFSSYYTVPQLLVWGMQQESEKTLDLTSHEVVYIFEEEKWQAIAKTFQLMKKNSLRMNVVIIDSWQWDTIGNAFFRTGVNVDTLDLSGGFSPLLLEKDGLPDFGNALKKMRVQSLNVSHNYLHTQTDSDWWEAFCLMLKHGNIQELDLSGNNLYSMTDLLWETFCQGLKTTNLKFVNIDYLSNSRMDMLKASLVKNSALSGSFFREKERFDTDKSSIMSYPGCY